MFNKIDKAREIACIQREVELFRKEQYSQLEIERQKKLLEIQAEYDKARQALTGDWSKIEHEYHSARQAKDTEIAKLDALIEAKKAILEQDQNTCNFLKEIIKDLTKMHTPQVK